jgi:hypothetical protein
MPETHGQIARRMTIGMAPGVFARAARDAVIHSDYRTLETMFPGMCFATRPVGRDQWELIGTGEDGSIVSWGVGA